MRKDYIDKHIDEAYERLNRQPGFVSRPQQVSFSKAVAWVLSSDDTSQDGLVVEAPTGIGKTIGYLVGALVASALKSHPPIYVATATKLLQEQIFNSDLEKLVSAGVLPSSKGIVLQKGASNYLCLKRIHGLIPMREEAETDPSIPLSADELDLTPDYLQEVLQSFEAKTWSGDFDHLQLTGYPPKKTYPIAVNTQTCTGKSCSHAESCAYLRKKSEVETAAIVVASHDLVLSVAKGQAERGADEGATILNRFIFDEAHNLPEKAINQGQAEVRLAELKEAYRVLGAIQKHIKRESPSSLFAKTPLMLEEVYYNIKSLEDYLGALDYEEETEQRRFPRASVPEIVKRLSTQLLALIDPVLRDLPGVFKSTNESAILGPTAVHEMENAYFLLKGGSEVLSRYAAAKPGNVFWVSKFGMSFRMSFSPLNSAEILSSILWGASGGYSAVFVSATLQTAAGFKAFVDKLGLPKKPALRGIDHVFNYADSSLEVVPMAHTPKLHERAAFTKEFVAKVLKSLRAESVSALILVPSWHFLREASEALKPNLGAGVLKVQGDSPLKELISRHKADTDQGKASFLLGTMSLAEGLDLRGRYCEHVHIATIPFPVPSSPYDSELSDVLGDAYFREHSLPSATTKLRQMVGRLIRSETDKGKVSIYDKRLETTGYGKAIIKTLPPFKLVQH